MCLYETERIKMSETMSHVKKSEKNTVRLSPVSPSTTPKDQLVKEYNATTTHEMGLPMKTSLRGGEESDT